MKKKIKSLKVPLGHRDKAEASRTLIIFIITIFCIVLISLFIFFGKQFVGKAITAPTNNLNVGEAGILIDARSWVNSGEQVTFPIRMNLGDSSSSVFSFIFTYDLDRLEFSNYLASDKITILEYDNSDGETTKIVGMVNPPETLTGEVNLMNITFNTVDTGIANIQFPEFIALNQNNQNIITTPKNTIFEVKLAPENCANGLDDDEDGLIDCNDKIDCSSDLNCCGINSPSKCTKLECKTVFGSSLNWYDNSCHSCVPTTCTDLGKQCGSVSDGCNNNLDCGNCDPSYTCENNVCILQCVPKTCEQLNRVCGSVPDECGNRLDCGYCPENEMCTDGQCVASCVNQCDVASRYCDGSNSIKCSDTNSDGCLELTTTPCLSGQVCQSNGACVQASIICGNGIKEGTEECDDGNLISNDGCSSACKIENLTFCTDSDNGNSELKGTITYRETINGPELTQIDLCVGNLLTEWSCSEKIVTKNNINCADAGKVCSNGACVTAPQNCVDPDNTYIPYFNSKGTILNNASLLIKTNIVQGIKISTYTESLVGDTCYNNVSIKEEYCLNLTHYARKTISCPTATPWCSGGACVQCRPNTCNSNQYCSNGKWANCAVGQTCSAGLCVAIAGVCGNKVIEDGEKCDGNTQSCTIKGYAGTQICNAACSGWGFCTSTLRCGDGIKNGLESCDGGDLNGQTCISQNLASGTLRCNNNCTFNYQDCKSATSEIGLLGDVNEDGCVDDSEIAVNIDLFLNGQLDDVTIATAIDNFLSGTGCS